MAGAEGDDAARAWFIGMNPFLCETRSVSACAGRVDDVRAAAKAQAGASGAASPTGRDWH